MKTKIIFILSLLFFSKSFAMDIYKDFSVDTSRGWTNKRNNQLTIHGAVYADNTVWRSSWIPYACPYNVKCDYKLPNSEYSTEKNDAMMRRYGTYDEEKNRKIAKRYDINQMRTFNKFDWLDDNWHNIYSWFPSSFRQNWRISDKPTIIKFDPRIISRPPPWFEGAM